MFVDKFGTLYLVFAASQNPFLKHLACDPHAKFRTIDGTCNNLLHPWRGAAKTPLIRMSPQRYQDGKMLIHQMPLATKMEDQLYGTPM